MNAEMNRAVHGAAGELVGKERAHEVASLAAQEAFKVKSLSELTNTQAEMLVKGFKKQARMNKRIIYGAMDQHVPINEAQLAYIRDMKRYLDWSDEYFSRMLLDRYNHDGSIETLEGWKAVRLVGMMAGRVKGKGKRGKEFNKG